MNGIALRIFATYPQGLTGMTAWEVQQIAEQYLGPGVLGISPWKRVGELNTEWDPPLIIRLYDEQGRQMTRMGQTGKDPNQIFAISPDGLRLAAQMRGARGE